MDQESCFLRKMEESDYDNVRSLLHQSEHKVTGSGASTRENRAVVLHNRVSLAALRICETTKLNVEKATKGQTKEKESCGCPFTLCQAFLKSPTLMCELAFLPATHSFTPNAPLSRGLLGFMGFA